MATPGTPNLFGALPCLQFAALEVLPLVRATDPTARRRRRYRRVDPGSTDWFASTVLDVFATRVVDRAAYRRRVTPETMRCVSAFGTVEEMLTQFCSWGWWSRFERWRPVTVEGVGVRHAIRTRAANERYALGTRRERPTTDVATAERLERQLAMLCSTACQAGVDGVVGLQCDAIANGRTFTETGELRRLLDM